MNNKRKLFLQSAMEYLATYGWAILIFIAVLAILFQLGIFRSGATGVTAAPGSCQLHRPYGPRTSQLVSLIGTCNSELPEYVAQFGGNANVVIDTNVIAGNSLSYTIAMWVYPTNAYTEGAIISESGAYPTSTNLCGLTGTDSNSFCIARGYPGGGIDTMTIELCGQTNSGGSGRFVPNVWEFMVLSVNKSSGLTFSINTTRNLGNPSWFFGSGGCYLAYPLVIGGVAGAGDNFNGSISNVQVYNTSLSTNEINALYQEGIGGEPVDIYHLVGWWPLDGNTNDYSGNGYNATSSSVDFSGEWQALGGYTPP